MSFKVCWVAGSVVVLLAVVQKKDEYPANLTLLGLFTFFEAVPVSALCFEVGFLGFVATYKPWKQVADVAVTAGACPALPAVSLVA